MTGNPWDIPPIPRKGDENEDATYAAVGRFLTQWECVEYELGYLYTCFVGCREDIDVFREYGGGDGKIFRDRVTKLKAAADAYFRSHPCQNHEGEFDELMKRCEGFSAGRNDIAHGIVQHVWFAMERDPDTPGGWKPVGREYRLEPPHYDARRHSQYYDPEYGYTSAEMSEIGQHLIKLRQDIQDYQELLFGSETQGEAQSR
jgi:hypothetical protein